MREVAVGLSAIVQKGFSQGKSFGKILGYLDAKTPVICSDYADHAAFFTEQSGVVSNDAEVWANALVALLDDPMRRQNMADLAYGQYCTDLSIETAADKVERFLRQLRHQ